ncbi:ion transporter [Azospirillum halopraeferens]|uniref:ion transporter n=1 Tax=Azospirillum halopraeferens TaxID=34010 RepID=UPI0004096E89|nr:ion transporter [Azospirillum halopraeferens]
MSDGAFFARWGTWIESPPIQRIITVLIVINAIILGLDTSPTAVAAAGGLLRVVDVAILAVFVVELTIRIGYRRASFFRDGWNVFDFLVVAIALLPVVPGLSVLRALRVLRVLRLITASPRLKLVVRALLASLPGLGAIAMLLSLLFYVAAVIATNLFGAQFDEWFGTLGRSIYTLFQVMTLESWSMGIVRPVMEQMPWAWLFFVPFIMVATFTMLNLFIAIIVGAMQNATEMERQETEEAIKAAAHAEGEAVVEAVHDDTAAVKAASHADSEALMAEIRALRADVAALRGALAEHRPMSAE